MSACGEVVQCECFLGGGADSDLKNMTDEGEGVGGSCVMAEINWPCGNN